MATENRKPILEENTSEVPADHELFVGEPPEEVPADHELFVGEPPEEVPADHELFVGEPPEEDAKADSPALGTHEEPSEREVSAGDDDFYTSLTDVGKRKARTKAKIPALGTSTKAAATQEPADASQIPVAAIWHRRLSTLQTVLIVSIVVITTMLLYVLLKSPSGPADDTATTPTGQQPTPPEPAVEDSTQAVAHQPPQQILKPESVFPPIQSLSLKAAETLYLQKDYGKAYAAYNRLRQSLPEGAEEELLRDFLQLRMALCMIGTPTAKSRPAAVTDLGQANRLFRTVLLSPSPAVRAVANYHLSLIEMHKKQYLEARTWAYQTIALISAVDFNSDWALSLRSDCHFLAAESMTKDILSLCDADKDVPDDLWREPSPRNRTGRTDPFAGLSETQLRSLLSSGTGQLRKGLLGPQIQKLKQTGGATRWSVVCHGASIEELLARFAANADLDIHWAFSKTPTSEGTGDVVRKRPVSLYLPETTVQQFVATAVGHVGLLARLDDEGIVSIYNPGDYSSLSEHIALLSQEAISLWQRFLLTFHDDKRTANAHFAIGLLQAQGGQVTDAIAEYKLVANRFSRTSLAPAALLHSSKLKTNLLDYSGARQDLKQLVEQYHDAKSSGRACLHLADATMKAGFKAEAASLYRKVHNLDLSLEAQVASALGAGKCFYETEDYQSAAKWLTRYISIAVDHPSKDLYSGYLLLGKTSLALGKPKQACEAFQYALTGQLDKEEHVEAISALVGVHIQQGHFVEALDVLENIPPSQFSQKESVEILLLKATVFRAVGLVDKAVAMLGDKAQYVRDSQLKARISFELARCCIAKGNLQLARQNLTEILAFAEPGPLAQEIAVELADVCSKLNQNPQTISICLQLLDSGPSPQVKQKALELLAAAYNRQKNYDRAALALTGRWNVAKGSDEKATLDSPATTNQSLQGAP